MNRREISEEEVFQERIAEEPIDMQSPLTALWGDVPLVESIKQRDSNPLLRQCKNCLKACKKHKAPGLLNFKCFDREI